MVLQTVAQLADLFHFAAKRLFCQLGGLAKADNAGDVFSSPAAPFFLVSADEKRCELGPLFHVERPHALGGMKLVAGQRQHVDAGALYIHRHLPGRLDGIRMEHDPLFSGGMGDLRYGKNNAGLVVCPHDANDSGILGHMVIEVFNIQVALPIDRHPCDPVTGLGQMLAQIFYCRMLHPGGNDVPFFRVGLKRCINRRAVALRAAAGEDDLAGLRINQVGDVFARRHDLFSQHPPECMHARGIPVIF